MVAGMDQILDKVVEVGNGFIEEREKVAAGKVQEDIRARVLFFTWSAHSPEQLQGCIQDALRPVCWAHATAFNCRYSQLRADWGTSNPGTLF